MLSNILDLIGRVFISAIFLLSGINKIGNYEGSHDWIESLGVPGILLIPAIVIEILFPLLIIVGYKTKFSAMILSLFAILLAIIFHTDFFDQMQLMSFLKNFAIAGGFLIILVRGAGKYSIDQKSNYKPK